MDLQLKDKVAIITGGAKGIGEGITRAFAAEGTVAVILGRNRDEAANLVAEITKLGQRAGKAGNAAEHFVRGDRLPTIGATEKLRARLIVALDGIEKSARE